MAVGWKYDTTNSYFSSSFRTSGFASELEAGGAKKPHSEGMQPFFSLRRDRDSNPRYDFVVYTLSRRAS